MIFRKARRRRDECMARIDAVSVEPRIRLPGSLARRSTRLTSSVDYAMLGLQIYESQACTEAALTWRKSRGRDHGSG
jgi:hypothetical protein